MFIAHLPAGYLATRRFANVDAALDPAVLVCGLVGSVIPDIDMIWFYAVDGRRHHHHSYVTHFPLVWAALLLMSFAMFSGKTRLMALAFTGNALLHMVLDTVAGDIRWLAPFSTRAFSFVTVPATHESWIASYVFHWTFLLELAITVVAAAIVWRDVARRRVRE